MAQDLPIIREALHRVGRKYVQFLQDELHYQKHIASGNLVNSFFTRVHKKGGSLVMDVQSNTSYMWVVNNGASPFEPSFNDIEHWIRSKQDFMFDNNTHESAAVATIVSNIATQGLPTVNGSAIASRRKFFIEVAFEQANQSGLQAAMEQDVLRQIDKEVGNAMGSKVIQLTIR